MYEAIKTPERFDHLIENGQKRVQHYTWMKTAKQTLNVYNNLSLL